MAGKSEISHPSLVDRVVERVFDLVIGGELKPGRKVTEDEIANGFGVSRTPVREAIKRLAEHGVLIVRPRCGLSVVNFDNGDLRQIVELREELEVSALKKAMPRITARDIERLEELAGNCEDLLKKGSKMEIFREDSRFHLALAELSGNKYLADALRRLDVKVQLCRVIFCVSMAKIADSVRMHRKFLASIRRRDFSEAETLLKKHIRGGMKE